LISYVYEMEIHQLRAFAAVAREGSVGAAARRLFRTQPAVTMAVRSLERSVGARLTERAGRGIRLTAAGETLFRLVDPILDQLESAGRRFRETITGGPSGPVRIAADADGLLYVLPSAIRAFQREHAGIALVLAQREASDAVALLKAGRLDVALCRLDHPPRGLEWRRLLTADPMVIAPRRIQLPQRPTLEWLATQPLVTGPPTAALARRVDESLARGGLAAKVALAGENWEVVKRYVGLGLGVGVVPGYALQRQDRRIAAAGVRHLFGAHTYGVVVRRELPAPAAARRLLAELVANRPPLVS
jgi:DNA-binding transcriptional LysR family regulator